MKKKDTISPKWGAACFMKDYPGKLHMREAREEKDESFTQCSFQTTKKFKVSCSGKYIPDYSRKWTHGKKYGVDIRVTS